ncbi:MAG TPA: extensin family protein [Hyphomicrobium sp.]|jgi:hypothetical protein
MPSIRVCVVLGIFCNLLLSACGGGDYFVAKEEPWRATEERACLASGAVQESPFIKTKLSLGGPNVCGAERPFELAATDGGRVSLRPAALLRCPMIPQVNHWVATVIDPAARRVYGVPLVELKIAASYACRPMNNVYGAHLSEHGHANALDVSAFVLADGRSISVKRGWRGDNRDRAFLQAVHDGACQQFTTVLGPDYDSNHHDHFHVDLARRGPDGLRTVCK